MGEIEFEVGCGAATALLDSLDAALDALEQFDRSQLSTPETLNVMRRSEVARRRWESAVDQRNIAHLVEANIPGQVVSPGAKSLLVELLRVSPREASARVRAAEDLGPRRALTGERLEPLFAEVAGAQAEGAISAEHASVITRAIKKIPAPLKAEYAVDLEVSLVEAARQFQPLQVARLAQRALAMLDPDGAEPDDREHERQRGGVLCDNADGSGDFRLHLTPMANAMAHAVLDPLSQPRPSEDAGPDTRTPAQRLHDAFEDALLCLLKDGGLPDTGGTPATLVLTMTLQDLESRTGCATTEHGGHVSVQEALRLAADASIIPVVFADTGGVVAYGRERRLADPGQRRALAARDKGCAFPGCDRPPGWCQAAHKTPWIHGGQTNLDDLLLLCGHHHRQYDRGKTGWQCLMINQVPHWLAPPWLDPAQTPRRNTAHD